MTWVVVVLMLMEVVETEVAIVQFEFPLLSGVVPQWGSSGHSPVPAM